MKRVLLSSSCALALFLAGFNGINEALALTKTIIVSNNTFTPANETCMVGDTIFWSWSAGTHTTTSGTIPAGATSWDAPISSTNTGFTYKVTTAGTYNYSCTIHAGMNGSFTASLPTGFVELSKAHKLEIYPNPAASDVRLAYSIRTAGDVEISAYDLLGNKVHTFFSGYKQSGVYDEPFETSGILSNGVYMLVVRDGKDQRIRRLLIER
jgi:plastocyanin